MAHVTFTPNTLLSHGRKAPIIPGIWSSQLLQEAKIWVQGASKRMTKRQYFATCPVAVKSLRNKKSIRECLIAPSHVWAALGGFLMTRPKVFFLLPKYRLKKGKLSRYLTTWGLLGCKHSLLTGAVQETDTYGEKVTPCQACPMWQRSSEAHPIMGTPHGLSIPLLRVHHHYTVHMAV